MAGTNGGTVALVELAAEGGFLQPQDGRGCWCSRQQGPGTAQCRRPSPVPSLGGGEHDLAVLRCEGHDGADLGQPLHLALLGVPVVLLRPGELHGALLEVGERALDQAARLPEVQEQAVPKRVAG